MNGGFCQRPFCCCVQRQTHHCGRSNAARRLYSSHAMKVYSEWNFIIRLIFEFRIMLRRR